MQNVAVHSSYPWKQSIQYKYATFMTFSSKRLLLYTCLYDYAYIYNQSKYRSFHLDLKALDII